MSNVIKLALMAPTGVAADGKTANKLTVTVTNASGAALVGQSVALTAADGLTASVLSGVTDGNGAITVSLTAAAAGSYNVIATLADGTTETLAVPFIAATVAESAAVADTSSEKSDSDDVEDSDSKLFKIVTGVLKMAGHDIEEDLAKAVKIAKDILKAL